MKVVTAQEMARIEKLAYDAGAKESDFMEAAGKGIAQRVQEIVEEHHFKKVVTMLCGKGNNAGDAYVAGTALKQLGYAVTAYQLGDIESCSHLCQENHNRFLKQGGYVKNVEKIDRNFFPNEGIILDGIFGTGFHGAARGIFADIIEAANKCSSPIIAIDIPSGVNGSTGDVEGAAIEAAETIFLGLPKAGCFLQEGWHYCGHLSYVDFGLQKQYLDQAKPTLLFLTEEYVQTLLPPIRRNRHKYQAGVVAGVAGSQYMPGAALLACLGAIKSGCGLMRLWYPAGMETQLSNSPYEVIKFPYHHKDSNIVLDSINAAAATFIGPGVGRTTETHEFLDKLLPSITVPSVLDADALFAIAQGAKPPQGAILTPHIGEMYRLLALKERHPLNDDFLAKVQSYAERTDTTVVLKGGPTFLFSKNNVPCVCPRGDAGMATGGSGDVLTGVISALLAQGLNTNNAATLGVYLHGIAGELAAEWHTSYSMIATDIATSLGQAFHVLGA